MARPRPARPCRLGVERLEDRAVPATFTVNSTLDNLTSGDGKLTLREAITRANNLAGPDVVVVPAGVFKIALSGNDDANFAGDFDIADAVTIRGAGRGKTVIDGQQLDRVFHARFPALLDLELRGMTIRNGRASNFYGGGILVENANLALRDCTVTRNRSFNGGSISQISSPESSSVNVVRCTVTNNVSMAGSGAGILVNDAELLTVTGSIIRQNVSRYLAGGIMANNVKLAGSTVSDNSAGTSGGGIWGIEVDLTGCTVSGNTAGADGPTSGSGGGISAFVARVVNSTVSGNVAVGDGGGILATRVKLFRSTIVGNAAGGQGGGVRANEDALVQSSTLRANVAGTFGGGLALTSGLAQLIECSVEGNRAGNSGGGINADLLFLNRSTVNGNTAALDGGGLAANQAQLSNATISGNTTGDQGGGVWAISAALYNSTVVKNVAAVGGGLFHEPAGSFFVGNTIVAKNFAIFGAPDASGDFVSPGGGNLIGDGTGSSGFSSTNADIVGTSLKPIDPKLGALAYNGGPTKTHKLLTGSIAIDAGNNEFVPPTDQRGVNRIRDGDGNGTRVVDIGAFER